MQEAYEGLVSLGYTVVTRPLPKGFLVAVDKQGVRLNQVTDSLEKVSAVLEKLYAQAQAIG